MAFALPADGTSKGDDFEYPSGGKELIDIRQKTFLRIGWSTDSQRHFGRNS